ncbi:DUF2634 domain-containing protein [Fodinisporobacter ferrooxydans]|uniref:DUF2634 domain-containing protein n=1 Tax=Fodinisporobacter ferrooxydans TaxID=2901836 RepID=A0ABY4CMU1_9BACL|nr:DUF2634 domain-containing protein [Alicyclobacillaceae bacterium MYW30-H2]
MKLATYIVGQGDTIEILAQQLLGDSTQDQTLIQINNLRYPYISDNPADQYARPKGNVYLTQPYTNPSQINISNPNGIVIKPNDTVFLSEGASYAAGIVQSITGGTITFQQPIQGTFDQAAIVTVYVDQSNITTQVLRTGDTLLYPANQFQNNGQTQTYSTIFGTDWSLDDNGFLMRSNGDIATVSGVDNLKQALKLRLQTELGALMLHPDYGSELFSILGEAGQTYFIGLAKHYITECAKQDIRVRDAQLSNVTFQNDSLFGTLTVYPIGSQDPISQPIQIPIGGV